MTSLYARFLQKIVGAKIIQHQFEKWYIFSRSVKVKTHKKKEIA
jgi:hypothetical protein